MKNVEIDTGGIVHDVGVVLAGENVTRAAHVGCELIDFIETAVDKMPHKIGVTKVAEYEIIGLRLAEAREFKIGPADPETFALKTTDKVMSDKAASPTDQRLLSRCWCRRHVLKLQLSFQQFILPKLPHIG
jgi:hypothetical protein